jgi:hypothetical protein
VNTGAQNTASPIPHSTPPIKTCFKSKLSTS